MAKGGDWVAVVVEEKEIPCKEPVDEKEKEQREWEKRRSLPCVALFGFHQAQESRV